MKKHLPSNTPPSLSFLGTGTWNQRARILQVAGSNQSAASVMLHMNRRLSAFELEILQAALLNSSDAANRQLVAAAIRTLGTRPESARALAILAADYESQRPIGWNVEAYHDSNPDADYPYYFEVTIEAPIPSSAFEEVKKVLTGNPSPAGKNALRQAFKDDPAVVEALNLNQVAARKTARR